jgi:hypothetical protein
VSAIEKLMALGAESCGGDLIWKRKLMGKMRNGVLDLTADGEAALAMDVTDVEVKEDKPKRKAKAAAPVVEAPEPEVILDMADLLGDE